MGWKIYSWIMGLICTAGLISDCFAAKTGFLDIVEDLVLIITVLGVICYAHKRRIISALFWKIFFFISLILMIGSLSFIDVYFNHKNFEIGTLVLGMIFLLPLFLGLYLYAFDFYNSFSFTRKSSPVAQQSQILWYDTYRPKEEKLRNTLRRTWYVLGIIVAIALMLFFVVFTLIALADTIKTGNQIKNFLSY